MQTISPKAMVRMREDWELGIKRGFSRNSSETWSVDLAGVEDDPDNGVEDTTISIRTSTLTLIFNTVCTQIQSLVERQLEHMGTNNVSCKAILLVGGFGESKYLYDFLKTSNRQAHPGVQILQDTQAISAVCRGATLSGLDYAKSRDHMWKLQTGADEY
jgi:hypothetical protein